MLNKIDAVDYLGSQLKKGLLGYYVTVETEPRMRKKNNPYFGRVKKRTTYFSPVIGGDYHSIVDRRTRSCNPEWFNRTASEAPQEFEATATAESAWKPSMHWYNDFVLQSNTDPEQFYLSLGNRPTTRYYTTWLLDGLEAGKDVVEEFLPFLYERKGEDARQSARGIPPEMQYRPWIVKFENLVEIRQGKSVIWFRGHDDGDLPF